MEAITGFLNSIHPFWAILLMTFLPIFELRASIPYGILGTDMPTWLVILLAILINWLVVAPIAYFFWKYIAVLLRRWPFFDRLMEKHNERTLKKFEKLRAKYGSWGVCLFIGVPLPFSGVYTGALIAYLIGMGFRRFLVVSLVGVIIAATAVSLIVLSGSEALDWMINKKAIQ